MRILIADQENWSRTALRGLLSDMRDVELVGECTDGRDILKITAATKPDIVFADLRLPHLPEIADLHSTKTPCPCVVATILDDEFALRALEYGAVDFVLKPFSHAAVNQSLIRARHFLARALDQQLIQNKHEDHKSDFSRLLQSIAHHFSKSEARPASDKLPVKVGTHIRLINLANIMYVRASGDYIDIAMISGERIHTKRKMTDLETRLPSRQFIRTHRSFIINKEYVREIRTKNNDYELILTDETVITSGSTYRKYVRDNFLINYAS